MRFPTFEFGLTRKNINRDGRCGLTSRAQARGTGDIRQPATSRQTESAIPRCLQRIVRHHFSTFRNVAWVAPLLPIKSNSRPSLLNLKLCHTTLCGTDMLVWVVLVNVSIKTPFLAIIVPTTFVILPSEDVIWQ